MFRKRKLLSQFYRWGTRAEIEKVTLFSELMEVDFKYQDDCYRTVVDLNDPQQILTFLIKFGDQLDPQIITALGRFMPRRRILNMRHLEIRLREWPAPQRLAAEPIIVNLSFGEKKYTPKRMKLTGVDIFAKPTAEVAEHEIHDSAGLPEPRSRRASRG